MTRNEYIQLRKKDEFYQIIWHYFTIKSKKSNSTPLNVFINSFNAWLNKLSYTSLAQGSFLNPQEAFNRIIETCIKQLDEDYKIITITSKKKEAREYIIE